MGSWFEALILRSRDGTSVCAFLSWSIPPGIWFLPPASCNTHTHTKTHTSVCITSCKTQTVFTRNNKLISVKSELNIQHSKWKKKEMQVHPSTILFSLWPVVWFAEEGLVVCIWAFPFPAFAAVPSQGCQGSSSGLEHKIQRKITFWLLSKYFHGGQTFQ